MASSTPPVWTVEGRAIALKRRARKQLEGAAPAERERGAGGAEFNMWYGKYLSLPQQDKQDKAGSKKLREERCNSYVDSGLTRANERSGVFFCQYFARGVCSSGYECPFFHLVPSAEDCARHDKNPTTDIFGRDRFAEEKGNMGGVGSFFSLSRTLYVAYGAASERLGAKLQETFERVFSEWGPLEDVYVVRGKSIAFVRFVFRASAELAKEAMHNQSFQPPWWPQPRSADNLPEVLNVRWAYEDPNPVSIRRNKREREEAYADALRRAEERLAPEQRAALAQQRALEDAQADGGAASTMSAYPVTEAQYAVPASAEDEAAFDAWAQQAAETGYTPEQIKAFYASWKSGLGASHQAQTAVAAPDAHEYDADDPSYAEDQGAAVPPAKIARGAPPPGPSSLALIAGYGSGSEDT